jgi:hypothetical protein
MNRWATVVVGAVLIALIGALVWKSGGGAPTPTVATAASSSDAGRDSPAVDSGLVLDPLLTLKFDGDGGLAAARAAAEANTESDLGPGLPTGSPKTVRFGVILIQYRGAEFAPPQARPKQEALVLARSVAEAASSDFKAQVHRGDPGSMEDAGRISRGVLEPSVELALFMLPRGAVSEPIDTPRGFWIVRRID